MKEWLKQFYGEHKWLSILAVAALVLGILFLCIGFWRTLLLAALVALGVLIVDIRHDPTADDVTMAEYFKNAGRPFVVAANKLDKLNKSQIAPNLLRVRQVLSLSDDVTLIPISCVKGVGRGELLAAIEKSLL